MDQSDKPIKVSGRANRATIDDVAVRAGVSTKTVSRVVNAEPHVREATRKKVSEAISDLDYRPNMSARSLAGSRSFLIGLIHDEPGPDYLMKMQTAVQSRCTDYAYHMLMHRYDITDPNAWDQLDKMIQQSRLDGLILTPPVSDNSTVIQELKAQKIPFVAIAPEIVSETECTVAFDEVKAAHAVTAHLIDLGHRHIGHIVGHPSHGASSKREAGYRQAMSEAGLTINEEWICQGYFSYKSGMECANKILNANPRPTAIFAADDDTAAGVMAIAGKLGLSVPDDISVAGINDTPIASIVWPGLTTIRQPISRMGAGAVDLLVSSLRAEREDEILEDRHIEFPFDLKVRSSTAEPKAS